MASTGNRQPKASPRQLEALRLTEAGRVEYGALHPAMARRAARYDGLISYGFIVNGVAPYGSFGRTCAALEDRGWITIRHDLVPTHTAPARTRTYRDLRGERTQTFPAHDEPTDPGWRTRVDLTDTGRAVLAVHTEGAGQ